MRTVADPDGQIRGTATVQVPVYSAYYILVEFNNGDRGGILPWAILHDRVTRHEEGAGRMAGIGGLVQPIQVLHMLYNTT